MAAVRKDQHCSKCGLFKKARELIFIDKKPICRICIEEIRIDKRNGILKEVKTQIHKEKEEIRERLKEISIKPKIKPIRKNYSRGLHFYLTKIEKLFLFRKYAKLFNEDEARKRVKGCVKYLEEFVVKLKEKRIEDEEINRRFKEEYAKLCVEEEKR